MKILVIGAAGFIGSHVGSKLASLGHHVTGLSRSAEKAPTMKAMGMDCALGDLLNLSSVCSQIQNYDTVIFAPQLLADEEYSIVDGLLEMLQGTGKTFVFTSGTGVLGQRTCGAWSQDSFAEIDPFQPLSAIAMRVETEQRVKASVRQGVRAMVIRPPRVWGHGARGHISMAYESVGVTGSACYIGAGFNMYSNVHIDDLADLYVLATERGVAGALYHAVCGEMSNRWIAESVARDLGCETRSVSMDEAMGIWGRYQTLIVLSVSSRSRAVRSREELGWIPKRLDMLEEIGLETFRDLAGSQGRAPGQVFDGRLPTTVLN